MLNLLKLHRCDQTNQTEQSEQTNQTNQPFYPLQHGYMTSNGAAAPLMAMMQGEQDDARILQYRIAKCCLFCYLFFTIPSIPIAAFVLWPYAILVWFGALIPLTLLVHYFVPNHSIPGINYVLYGSLAMGVFSTVFGTILSSSHAVGWISLYASACGIQDGLFVGAAIKLFRYGRHLRSQGLDV